jgi:hypothetical protein
MTTPTTVQIGDRKVPLTVPASMASRYDVLISYTKSPTRAAHAALGLCWTGPGRPKAAASYDVCEYGGRVMDELCARGVSPVQSMAAAIVAFNLAIEGLVTESEVEDREGNFEGQEGSTS